MKYEDKGTEGGGLVADPKEIAGGLRERRRGVVEGATGLLQHVAALVFGGNTVSIIQPLVPFSNHSAL